MLWSVDMESLYEGELVIRVSEDHRGSRSGRYGTIWYGTLRILLFDAPGGKTNVLPMATAKVMTTSMAMRILLKPPPSGSKVKYRSVLSSIK